MESMQKDQEASPCKEYITHLMVASEKQRAESRALGKRTGLLVNKTFKESDDQDEEKIKMAIQALDEMNKKQHSTGVTDNEEEDNEMSSQSDDEETKQVEF